MSFSKTQVDRAGRELSQFFVAAAEGRGARLDGDERERLLHVVDVVEWWRRDHSKGLSRVAANLRYYASEQGLPTVAQRLKKFPSITGKLIRQRSMRLAQMADIGGVRAVLPNLEAVQQVAVRLRRNWTITDTADYVTNPKAEGYRAIHLVNKHRGRLIEVQLRTPRQHSWANAVEADARRYAPGLKWGIGPVELTEFYSVAGKVLASVDAGELPDPDLMAEAERLQERAATFRREQG